MVSVGPSQATGRVQPRHTPTRAMRVSSASSALTISSTWTAPAAWRKVPQVVATGNTRLVTRKVTTLTTTSGRSARDRPVHGRATRPIRATGNPGAIRTLTRLCQIPSIRSWTRRAGPDRQVARQRRRVAPGEDVEAADRQGIGQRLARQRVAEDRPVADGPRGEDHERDDRRDADDREPLPARAAPPGQPGPGQGEPHGLVAGQRGEAEDGPETEQPRVAGSPVRRVASAGSGSSAASPRGRRWRTASSSRAAHRTGRAAATTTAVRPVPRASVRARPGASPRSSATSAASRQARTGTSDPTRTAGTLAASNVGPSSAIAGTASRLGSGSQTSNAGRGNWSGGVWKLQIASLTRPRPLDQVAGDPDVVRGVLGGREAERRREDGPHDERRGEEERGAQPRLAAGHGTHLGSAAVRQIGIQRRIERRSRSDRRAAPACCQTLGPIQAGRVALRSSSGAERRDGVLALDEQPARVVRPRDRLDRGDRIGRGDDAGMTGPVLDAAGVEAHHHVVGRGTGGGQRRARGHLDVPLARPDGPGGDAEPDPDEDRQHDRSGHERPARLRGIPVPPCGQPDDGRDDALEGEDGRLRGERDRRVDERPVRDVDGRDQRREREQDARRRRRTGGSRSSGAGARPRSP